MASTNEKEKAPPDYYGEDGRRRAVREDEEEEEPQQQEDDEESKRMEADDDDERQQPQQPQRRPQKQPRAFQGGWQGFALDKPINFVSERVSAAVSETRKDDDGNKKQPTENSDEEQQQQRKSDQQHAGAGVPPTRQQQQQKQQQHSQPPADRISRWERRFPRTYHVLHFVVAPLLLLIALAFLCGYLAARLEGGRERESNDGAMAGIVRKLARLDRLRRAARESPRLCLESYYDNNNSSSAPSSSSAADDDGAAATAPFNRTDLERHMIACGERLASEVQGIVDAFAAEWGDGVYDALTFDWTVCGPPNRTHPFDRVKQTRFFADRWVANLHQLLEEREAAAASSDTASNTTATTSGDLTPEEVALLDQVVASDQCEVNAPAGALFWFTVMTTIGYGNATPQTPGGRILVYTIGFLSILLFTGIIGRAGYVLLVVADDLFLRRGWPRLTRGVPAAAFWAAVFVPWVMVIAGVAMAWSANRYEEGFAGMTLRDAMWFAYVSVTTIGFGDLHIPHDTVKAWDMIYLPLIFLIGFVLLANFLLKLADVIMDNMKLSDKPSLESQLEWTRSKGDNRIPSEETNDVVAEEENRDKS